MRISKKYLIPYLVHSVTKTTREEKVYWSINILLGLITASIATYATNWWSGIIMFILYLICARFPVLTKGKYPMSERKYYTLKKAGDEKKSATE